MLFLQTQIAMNQCAEKLTDVVEEAASQSADHSVELLSYFRRLMSDVIAGAALGLETDAIENPNDKLLVNCQGVIDDTTKQPLLYLLGCESTFQLNTTQIPTITAYKASYFICVLTTFVSVIAIQFVCSYVCLLVCFV